MHRPSDLERSLGPYAIPNLTLVLIVGQVLAFLLGEIRPDLAGALRLEPAALLRGEWWRLVTFLFEPASRNPLFLLFGLMLLHLMGNALESHLGTVRYNGFVLTSWAASVAVALVAARFLPAGAFGSNLFLYESIFLAFAWLYPDFELLLAFILPVKIKWLALLALFGTLVAFSGGVTGFASGGWFTCLMILAANVNLLLFFGADFLGFLRAGNRRMTRQLGESRAARQPRHTCIVCGATNLSHPDRDFRYCPECAGTPAYCSEHLAGHVHRTEGAASDAPRR